MENRGDLADLAGRSALVTGAGDVGATIAVTLARHNAGLVAVVDLDGERAQAVAERVEAAGARGIALVGDLTAPATPKRLQSEIAARGEAIDILVNNAGMPPNYFEAGRGMGPFVDSAPEDWAPLLELNLEGVLHMTHAFLGPMIERGWGRLVTIVSDAARVGDRNLAVYAAAKGGASAFMRSLASEVGQSGVTANCISLSTLWRGADPPDEKALRRVKRDYALGRYGTPEDVASMVAFLASDAAAWVTGQVYGVNGGYAYGL